MEKQQIAVQSRLIHALDVPDINAAKHRVEILGDTVQFYKIGLELLMAPGYFSLLDWLQEAGKEVFVDLKFFDVPETVARAVRQLNGRGIRFVTVHGNDRMMAAAAEAATDVGVLAVTALTSLDRGDLDDLGFQVDVTELVLSRARRAVACGCAGVVASGLEAQSLREALGNAFMIITPGIRPVENKPADDQKRTVSVEQAFSYGADYIVVGRPIGAASNPAEQASVIQQQIKTYLAS
jgi:orotidine-5'-phosphate decarboxylase